jgi:hypothetical protein
MTRRKDEGSKATTHAKVTLEAREHLKGLKAYLKADTYSEAISLAHLRLTGSLKPWEDGK